ncbi:MAG: urease subunit beta [Firmicutes bacterium]|nr:urease subunit beta [Bacillota bacterium]
MNYEIGQIIFAPDPVVVNDGMETVELVVNNTGDRTIQVCSHYHFFEANIALRFEREKAFGYRLDIPAGTAVRFEPGEDKKVTLVPFKGEGNLYGFMGMTMGNIHDPQVKKAAIEKMKAKVKECE